MSQVNVVVVSSSNLHQGFLDDIAAVDPSVVVMDGRKAFVTGGPATGELVEPGVIMASGDMVAIDVEALRILGAYKAKNKLLPDPYDSPQVETALSHDLGSRHYEVVT